MSLILAWRGFVSDMSEGSTEYEVSTTYVDGERINIKESVVFPVYHISTEQGENLSVTTYVHTLSKRKK